MQLDDGIKENTEKKKNVGDASRMIEEAGKRLTDEELGSVGGGFGCLPEMSAIEGDALSEALDLDGGTNNSMCKGFF